MSDLLAQLRSATRARVALGRAGDALPTARLLELKAAHAAARDAVHTPLDVSLLDLGDDAIEVHSAAPDRTTYLQRPDLGRQLAEDTQLEAGEYELAIVVADGLSPLAVHSHASAMVAAIRERLEDWTLAPVVIAHQARVALGDKVALALGARMVVVCVGERPGMSSTDSLGLYLTYDPKAATPDSLRNCLSNVRPPHGTGYEAAARTLSHLLHEARRRGLSGTELKADPALEA